VDSAKLVSLSVFLLTLLAMVGMVWIVLTSVAFDREPARVPNYQATPISRPEHRP